MEKKILLLMNDNKEIEIHVNEEIRHKILADDRKINAQEIYDILDYAIGDKYSVRLENLDGKDPDVLKFFFDLISEIIDSINDVIIEDAC